MKKGIFVSCSAGNGGPDKSSLSNESPWILTVGASNIDRNIEATAFLGNKDTYDGQSLYQPKDFPSTLLPLIYPGINSDKAAVWCLPKSLDDIDVKGKVVSCEIGGHIDGIDKGYTVRNAGGAAIILINDKSDSYNTYAYPHVLPTTYVSYDAGKMIKSCINSTSKPVAIILFKGTVIGDKTAPTVAAFLSSRGPNLASPGILKPNIICPGGNVLAAWYRSLEDKKNEKATFNMISGTSRSCPQLSGIAAMIKKDAS